MGFVVVVIERPLGLAEPFFFGGDLVVGGDLELGRRDDERPLLNGALVVDVVDRGRVVEVAVEAARLVVFGGRRPPFVLRWAGLGAVVVGDRLAVVGGERRPLLRRPLLRRPCDAGLVVGGTVARVVDGAVDVVDRRNEVSGTTATRVVGGPDVVAVVVGACFGAGVDACFGAVVDAGCGAGVDACFGAVLCVCFGGGGFFLGEWAFFLEGARLGEWTFFLALWMIFGVRWTVVDVVKVGYGTGVPSAKARLATPLANASVAVLPLMAPLVKSLYTVCASTLNRWTSRVWS